MAEKRIGGDLLENLGEKRSDIRLEIPEAAAFILNKLEEDGQEAFVVGGCVRDAMLGRKPKDWDITTSARPEQVKGLFRRTIDTGIQHGTVTVMIGSEGYEVTTYRMDGEYEDHRHPKEVIFTPDLVEDLKRRDFTINAMAYNETSGLIDEFDGLGDLERRCIRCVGSPRERFEEDALRMLRGIRFAGQLQFHIEEKTKEAIGEIAPTLVNVSAERIRTELTKLLCSKGSDRLMLAEETGLMKYFLPEFSVMLKTEQNNPHHCFDVGHHSLAAVSHIQELYEEHKDAFSYTGWTEEKILTILVYGALLHDVAKPDCRTVDEEGIHHFHGHPEAGAKKAKQILRRLKFDNDTISMVGRMILYHDRRYEQCYDKRAYCAKGKRGMRRLMNQIGEDAMPFLFLLQKADLLAQSDYTREEKLAKLSAAVKAWKDVLAFNEAVKVSDLSIGGRDLIRNGIAPGPGLGEILHYLLEQVLEDPALNEPGKLLSMALKYNQNKKGKNEDE